MKKPWTVWLTNAILSKIHEREQIDCAKSIYPERQAIIIEETIELDEEHIKGSSGPRGVESKRGTI